MKISTLLLVLLSGLKNQIKIIKHEMYFHTQPLTILFISGILLKKFFSYWLYITFMQGIDVIQGLS